MGYNLLINGVFLGVKSPTELLTFDPNFQQDIQVQENIKNFWPRWVDDHILDRWMVDPGERWSLNPPIPSIESWMVNN